ncbi:hypothetical protein [Pontibacter beigongshangensis]|uniref:hypothetical protein n=1 Tax=Pontibacter beigongshangensis TaxID=2574733 RepID=UPI00164F6489|nr:hypothetical protein [Pontibacter beigongshangensis]
MNFETEIKKLVDAYSQNEEGISGFRHSKLFKMYDYYLKYGFPEERSMVELSLVPAHFQEANYDGIHWSGHFEDLGHLTNSFEVDCMFHNKGKTRKELTPSEFEQYMKFSYKAIDAALDRNRSKTASNSISKAEFDELLEEIEKKELKSKKSFWSWLVGKA